MNTSTQQLSAQQQRQRWISVLARADFDNLQKYWDAIGINSRFTTIRPAEIGLAQVQGRIGASGRKFNMGDVTISRAVIQLESGEMGYSYVQGRNKQHAEIAAIIDALMQADIYNQQLESQLIEPLAAIKLNQEQVRQQAVSSSKVDFFTLVRGED